MIDDIKDYHLDSASSIALLETIEIKHSLWHEPLRYVTNHSGGIATTLEDDSSALFEYMPLLIKRGNTSDDLDQSLSITVGDLGQVVPPLIKLIRDADSDEKPEVIYRTYAFDVKTMALVKEKPLDVIKGLNIKSMNRDYQATSFEAKTSDKNSVKTGKTYNLEDYPGLKGYL